MVGAVFISRETSKERTYKQCRGNTAGIVNSFSMQKGIGESLHFLIRTEDVRDINEAKERLPEARQTAKFISNGTAFFPCLP